MARKRLPESGLFVGMVAVEDPEGTLEVGLVAGEL